MTGTVLVAGAGLAGARVAENLRALGFEGRIVVAGDEPHAPYERPALSKELLAGARSDVSLRPFPYWREHEIELRLGAAVTAIDARNRTALVATKPVHWDALVLATGARARTLDGPAGVHALRTLADARAVDAAVGESTRVVIVGAGFVGAETASTLLPRARSVTVVEPLAAPLLRVVGPEVGDILARRYREHGVELRLGRSVARISGGDRVRAVELDDGSSVAADVVVVGIGAVPVSPFGGAVDVDEHGRAALPGVYACGDVAAWWRPSRGHRLRVEHWTSASGQARAVAAAIAGRPEGYDEPPYFWSDQFGLRLQHVGHAETWHALVLEGAEDAFTARYVDRDGRLLAALAVNQTRAVPGLRRELAA